MPSRARSAPARAASGSGSYNNVRAPDWAASWAMPEPMVPAPTTPMTAKSMAGPYPRMLRGSGSLRRDHVGVGGRPAHGARAAGALPPAQRRRHAALAADPLGRARGAERDRRPRPDAR